MSYYQRQYRPHHAPHAPLHASEQQEATLRQLRIATRVQWRYDGGVFQTYGGGMRERDMLLDKGLPVAVKGTDFGNVLALTPQQAEHWLTQRQASRQR